MSKGYTLIEIIIVSAIIIILAGMSIAAYGYFQGFNVLDSVRFELIQNLRLAQNKAENGNQDSNFGVYFQADKYTLYKGDSYASRDQNQDQVFDLSSDIILSGLAEINFAKKTGLPSTTGALVLTRTTDSRQESIVINQAGLIY